MFLNQCHACTLCACVCGCVVGCVRVAGKGGGGGRGHCNCVIQFGESASILRCSDFYSLFCAL